MARDGPPKVIEDAIFRSNGINALHRVFNGAVVAQPFATVRERL